MPALVLASSSSYRQTLLRQLGLPFECASPDIDETPLPQETPLALVQRLASAKAAALAKTYPNHLIIGSDQAASLDGQILGKPMELCAARAQLTKASGRRVEFFTGLCLLDSRSETSQCLVEPFSVVFRKLSAAQIERYLLREKPFDCAGSFKVEGLGIALFERLEGRDYSALIGLPLIQLCTLLQAAGIEVI